MRAHVIAQIQIEQRLDATDMLLCFYREEQLYAVIKVTRHPVGTGKIQLLLAAVGKPEDTAVLQLPAYNTAHRNIIADALNARAQTANTAHNQINMYACGRSLVQLLDYGLVNQRVHLGDDVSLTTGTYHSNFIVNQRVNLLAQSQRRHNQLVPNRWLAVAAKQIEERRSIAAELIVRRHQAKVGIQLCGAVVIVACTQMQITPDAVILLAHNQNNFGMCL